MSRKRMFQAFSDEQQKDYEREARLQWVPDTVNASVKRWKDYTPAQQQAIMDEGNQIYNEIADAIEAGTPSDSPEVQDILVRWHNHLRYFYEPSLDTLRGLGELYNTHPDFLANFQQMHPDLAAYMQAGINVYVDALETAEIERLLAEDEAQRLHQNAR
jgi:hypothetical protein